MTDTTAAGRKTERVDRFEDELIAGIAVGRQGLTHTFMLAERFADMKSNANWDAHDVIRAHGHAVGDAIGILKAIAEVTLAAAKLRGEFNHRYHVTREGEGASKPEGSKAQ